MGAGALFIAVFLACAVEAVEATTIVLAAGTARDWRSASSGVIAALVVLAVITAALGPAVSALPISALRLFVGALLLIFGLQWLRKAILRASGHKALHDEDAIYREQLSAARSQPGHKAGLVPDLFGLHPVLQGRAARGTRGGLHRADLRRERASDPAGRARRGQRGAARRAGRGRGPRAAGAGPREHDEVRGRHPADSRSAPSGAPRVPVPAGRDPMRRCWSSSRPSPLFALALVAVLRRVPAARPGQPSPAVAEVR